MTLMADAAMDPREPLSFDPPKTTDLHLSKVNTTAFGEVWMAVGYGGDATFIVKTEAELLNLLFWFHKMIQVKKIQPYQ